MGSLAQSWFDEGWTEGQTEGLAKGRAALLERQLARRFGPLSEDVRARLAQATAAELGDFAEAVLDANNLDDVLASGSGEAAAPADPGDYALDMLRSRELEDLLDRVLLKTGRDSAVDKIESMRREYFVNGRAKGLTAGLAEGRAELLERQLTRRFGPLSEAGRTRVAEATLEELDGFAEAVLDAESADDVLANGAGLNQTFIDLQGIVAARLAFVLCCALTASPKRVEALVRHRLPRAARVRLADEPFTLAPSSFVGDDLEQYCVARLAHGRLRDGRDIYVAFAFRNEIAPGIVEHLARSRRLIQKRHPLQHPERPHPVVLPFVLYSGKQPWDVPGAAAGEEEIMELFGPDPALRYLLLDAEREEPARAAPDAETRSALRALTWERSGTAQDLRTIFGGVEERSGQETRILRFLREAKGVGVELLEAGCFADRPHLRAAGRPGLAEEWEALGRAEGLRALLLEMLGHFFGHLKDWMHECIDEASPRQLKHWILAVRDANCIYDVLR